MFCNTVQTTTLLVLVTAVGAFPAVPRSAPATFDLPLTWTPFGLTTDAISIGTPPQKVTSFVDWTWIGQYAFTTLCNGSTTDTRDCLGEGQIKFDQSLSKTFKNESDLYPAKNWNPNHFFSYDDLSVRYGSDIEHVGPIDARITIMAADMHFKLPTQYPFGGVFGLSPVFRTDNASTQSPFYQMWASGAFSEPIVAFHYCYNGSIDANKKSCQGADGLQTLGGYNENFIKDGITWYDNIVFPEVNNRDFVYSPALLEYWALPLTHLSLGDEEQALNQSVGAAAVFDHASYGRGAPLSVNAYNNLVKITNGKNITLEQPPNNGNQSFVQVECDKTSEFPVLKYQFGKGTKTWEIKPDHYVEKLEDGTCVLNVRTLGDGDMVIGNFGETFAKDKYILFDFEKLKVGIADLQW